MQKKCRNLKEKYLTKLCKQYIIIIDSNQLQWQEFLLQKTDGGIYMNFETQSSNYIVLDRNCPGSEMLELTQNIMLLGYSIENISKRGTNEWLF